MVYPVAALCATHVPRSPCTNQAPFTCWLVTRIHRYEVGRVCVVHTPPELLTHCKLGAVAELENGRDKRDWHNSGLTVAWQWADSGLTVAWQWSDSGLTVAWQWPYSGLTVAWQRPDSDLIVAYQWPYSNIMHDYWPGNGLLLTSCWSRSGLVAWPLIDCGDDWHPND